jgi:hypothetical protein
VALLHVALQEGFSHDEVFIAVGGSIRHRFADVTTKNQIGFADAVDLDVSAGVIDLRVRVPTRNIDQTVPVTLEASVYVGLSISVGGQLTSTISPSPFGYL